MNNNFVVSIPKELKTIKSKLFLINQKAINRIFNCFSDRFTSIFLTKSFSVDVALYGLFFTACPAIFATIFTKDGMPAETWIKLYLEYKYLNPQKRYFKVSKGTLKLQQKGI